jgi:hypothetical protein
MKIFKRYITLFLLSGFFFMGCDKPAITELVQEEDEDEADIEIITDDPFLNTGFDSTGVVGNLTSYTNVIILSGIKKSLGNSVFDENSTAQAIFFDRSNEIKDPNGKRIGFATVTPGIVKFDNNLASIVPLKVRFRENLGFGDTVLGNQYLLYRNRFTFRYNSSINFDYSPFQGQNSVNFDITTPPEINVSIKKEGNIRDHTLRVLLEWNKNPNPSSKLEIILGAYLSEIRAKVHIPLYRFKNINDDGSYVVPMDIINQLPADSFDALTFTIIRKYERVNSGHGNFISIAQSIHSTGIIRP